MKALMGLMACAMAVTGCASASAGRAAPPESKAGAPVSEDTLTALAAMLDGAWSSAALAARDADYLAIRTVNVRIWANSPDHSGAWFYTESARPDTPAVPYRQNVFNLVAQDDGRVHAYQYRVRDPARFAGAALRNQPPETLKIEDLIALPGCTLVWRRSGPQRFDGAMRREACRNTFRGAVWMDGSSWVTPDALYTWDRGMGADGRQVWGPTKAGYAFERAAQ